MERMSLTAGKRKGLEAVSNDHGVIAALALDQRGLLKNMLARELGAEPPASMISEFKSLVAGTLTKYASSILLDVTFGLDATQNIHGKGLMLSYEKAGYSPEHPEKLPSLTEGWSALRLREAGADAVKALVYYSPHEQDWVNDQKKAWVERIGAECRAIDIPLFLEFLGYDERGGDETGIEYARRKPEIVMRSIEEFSKERYGADVLKVEVPLQMKYVEGTGTFGGEKLHTRQEAMALMREAAALTDKPFVYLSAGVTNAGFVETLELAIEAGVDFHGVLCGRASWQGGVPVFAKHGAAALEEWLASTGAQNVQNVNRVLAQAKPWREARSVKASAEPTERSVTAI